MNDDFRPVQRTRPSAPEAPEHPPRTENKHPEPRSFEPDKPGHKQPKRRMLLLAAPRKIHWWLKNLSRRQVVALGVALLIFLVGGGVLLRYISGQQPTVENSSVVETKPPEPTTVASRMTGNQVAPELNNLPVTGVMIENSPDARPQSGLTQADMVFEAIAEGGITRFLALYQESQPEYLGPVRSARPYYLDFLVSFDAAIAHAGGSAEALAQIRNEGIKDMDHGANGASFQRVSNRYAPHNLYTSRASLLEIHNKRGYTTSDYKSFPRKADSPTAVPTARTVDFAISSYLYNPHYDYDAATNSYKRSEGGKPHTDERSGVQISPKVVIALVMPHRYAGIYSVYQVTGTGTAFVFQDGTMQQVTWEKANRKGQLMLKDASGAEVSLNAGQTWLSLVTDTSRVTYAP